jgi:hypothetical protein
MRRFLHAIFSVGVATFATAGAQELPVADPGSLAFEEGRWEDVITEYRVILENYPEDRLSWLRIAMAERELGRYDAALETLDRALVANAPEGMIELERSRNLLALGRRDAALGALEAADHVGLRALELIESASDFDPLRDDRRFQVVHANVRARVYPCETLPEARQFDFWLGRWEVRGADGTLLGYDTITRAEGGCAILEQWEGSGGSAGRSMSFYLPSREQWRTVWSGSAGNSIDMTGSLVDGEMVMEGTIEYVQQNRVVAIRARWTPGSDGRVRQRIEEFNLAGPTWDLWFDGFFRRADE